MFNMGIAAQGIVPGPSSLASIVIPSSVTSIGWIIVVDIFVDIVFVI
jgi:hypothetical protein